MTWRDSVCVAGEQIKMVDLVEWVAEFSFALKHEGIAAWG